MQAYGGHADEIETSNILNLRPDLVDMSKAVDDSSMKNNTGITITPTPIEGGILNTNGINGYSTLGNKKKGQLAMEAFTGEVLKDIDSISTCQLPSVKNRAAEYKKYEGTYSDATGKKLIINQKDNYLNYIWNGLDFKNFSFCIKLQKVFFLQCRWIFFL